MKTNAIVRIVLFSVAIFLLLGILGAAFAVKYYVFDSGSLLQGFTQASEDEPLTIQGNSFGIPAEDVQKLDIEWVAGKIFIQAVEGQAEISISEAVTKNNKHQMFCTKSGSTLKIEFSEATKSFSWIGTNGFNANAKDLLIVVPMDWDCRELSIDTAAGDVFLTNLTIDQVDFDGASGVFTIENCTVRELDIDTASGDVSYNGTLDALDFDAASASFSGIIHNCPRQLEIDSMSGRLELFLPTDCGFALTNDSLSGRLSSDFEINAIGDAMVHGDGSCRIDVSGLSGDVHINKHAAASTEAPCTDESCTDTSHGHSTTCTDDNCTDVSHNHSSAKNNHASTDSHHNKKNHN